MSNAFETVDANSGMIIDGVATSPNASLVSSGGNKTSINIDGLRSAVSELKACATNFWDVYQQDIDPALEMTQECFRVAGVDYNDLQRTYAILYSELQDRVNTFEEFLNNTVIPTYTEFNSIIARMFNQELRDQLDGYLSAARKNN